MTSRVTTAQRTTPDSERETPDSEVRRYRVRRCTARGRASAFTLLELLVVIVIIGILVGLVGVVGVRVIGAQKRSAADALMRTVRMAVDQFAEEKPLTNTYDTNTARTFGPYPPYQLAGDVNSNPFVDTVREAVEPSNYFQPAGGYSLAERLWRDLGNNKGGRSDWVSWDPNSTPWPHEHDDGVALYVYMKVFSPGVLAQVPESSLKPLNDDPNDQKYVNPMGEGTALGAKGLVDVLAIHDPWGVPLDYLLYVKLEYGPTGVTVTQRHPVLRCRGVHKSVADANEDNASNWMFASPLPVPMMTSTALDKATGALTLPAAGQAERWAGWTRAKAAGDNYTYVP